MIDAASEWGCTFVVGKIGASADLFDFAHRYAVAYGAIAVAMALMAGWLAGAVFRRV